MSITIRAATTDDVDSVLALWSADADPGRTVIDEPEHVHRLLTARGGSLLVATEEDAVVGTVIAGWDGWRGSLYRLVVAAGYRRQGLARRLVAAAEQQLRAQGCERVTALVSLLLAEAPHFWPTAGYHLDQAVGRFVRNL